MSNPFTEVYAALKAVISSSDDIRKLAEVAAPLPPEQEGIDRKPVDPGDKITINIIPAPGGACRQMSSSHTRVIERFYIRPIAGYVPHATIMALKWATLKAVWANRRLGLSYVELVNVDLVERTGKGGVGYAAPTSHTWAFDIQISVAMLLDGDTLPRANGG